jgi:5-carboxymethyl-2-hydroxymuconate isomerase
MPHLRIDYSANLEAHLHFTGLCKALAVQLAALRDKEGRDLYPLVGTRVLAYPAPHHAVAGGRDGFGFIYLNLRVTPGRSEELIKATGDALMAIVQAQCAPLLAAHPVGITFNIDQVAPSYVGNFNNLASHVGQG